MKSVILDLLQNAIRIAQYLADNPKRANARECLNHGALFPCEYCFAKGSRITTEKMIEDIKKIEMQLSLLNERVSQMEGSQTEEFDALLAIQKELQKELKKGKNKKSHIVWPYASKNQEPRSNIKMIEIAENIENGSITSPEDKKGVIRRSPLYDMPSFNFTKDVVVDYMHAVCIGVGKRLLELTFKIGEQRPRNTTRKLSSPSDFDKLMLNTKVPHESSRRARELKFSVMKAAEYRNIILFIFPYVLSCIESDAEERKVWLLLAYMIRSCILPQNEFQPIPLSHIDYCCEKFYSLYEKLFGKINCTYNTHVVCSHLIEMIWHGPLTATSTFPFESFYGDIRHSFVPGTMAPLKQIFQKVLLKRSLETHFCEIKIHYTDYDTALECNTLIYTFIDLKHYLYKIVQKKDDDLHCREIEVLPAIFSEVSKKLDWAKVGVFKEVGTKDSAMVHLNVNNVHGKVVRVGEYLITCPESILKEK